MPEIGKVFVEIIFQKTFLISEKMLLKAFFLITANLGLTVSVTGIVVTKC